MELIIVNSIGKVRRATYQGREYLVAPVRMVVPGVMNGSKGAIFYPPDEVAVSADYWNGMPIVVNHPKNRAGDFISARSPEVLEAYGIGAVYNAHIHDSGALDSEGWFDVERTRRVEPRIVDWLLKAKPIEQSVGVFPMVIEPVPAGKALVDNQGRPYSLIARDYRPDHLAILPDHKGACSIETGCGVLVNSMITNCECTPVANSDEVVKRTFWQKIGEALGIVTNTLSHRDIEDTLRQQIYDRFPPAKPADPNGPYDEDCMPPYLIDVWADHVVYATKGNTYALPYSLDGDKVSLANTSPQKVQRVTTWEPVANQEMPRWMILHDGPDYETGLVTNGYPSEHAARIADPKDFLQNTFRRKEIGKGISIIVGKKTAGGPMMVQSYRFARKKFTADEAQKWLKDHSLKTLEFAPATPPTNNAATKKDGEDTLLAADYAYTPDPKEPSTWRLRIDDAPHVNASLAVIANAYRGNGIDIPASALLGVKRKIRAAWKKFYPDKPSSEIPEVIRNQGEPMTTEAKNALISRLIANAAGINLNIPWRGMSAQALSTLSDDTLVTYDLWDQQITGQQQQPVVNQQQPVTAPPLAVSGHVANQAFIDAFGNLHTEVTPGVWQSRRVAMHAPTVNVAAGAPIAFPVAPPVQQQQPVYQVAPPAQVQTTFPGTAGYQPPPQQPPAAPVANQVKAMTEEEWLASAPPSVRARHQALVAAEAREKGELVEKLVVNVDLSLRDQTVAWLSAKPIEELRGLLLLQPQQAAALNTEPTVNFLAQAGAAIPSGYGAGVGEPLLAPKWEDFSPSNGQAK